MRYGLNREDRAETRKVNGVWEQSGRSMEFSEKYKGCPCIKVALEKERRGKAREVACRCWWVKSGAGS